MSGPRLRVGLAALVGAAGLVATGLADATGFLVAASFVVAAGPAHSQTPGPGQQTGRDNLNQPVVGTGSISGSVILDGVGTPVRRARVSLSGAELRGSRSAVTDDQGRFGFAGLPAGRFTLTASKPGYVNMAYGAKKPGRAGTPIQLGDGQRIGKATITLPKGSVVTGVVIDEGGEPSPGTQVRVMRFVTQTGERTLQQAGQAQTDDRGIYRIYGLQPGDYLVSAVPRNMNIGDLVQVFKAQVGDLFASGGFSMVAQTGQQLTFQATPPPPPPQQKPGDQTVGYAPVYYPGTTNPAAAAKVTLAIGEERSGVDFQLQLVPTAKVEGSISSADGTLPPGTQVTIVPAGQQNVPNIPGVSTDTVRTDQMGKFSFSNVTPGQYTLMARAFLRDTSGGQPGGSAGQTGQPMVGRGGRGGTITQVLWASADVSVSGQNISDVVLNLQPGMTVAGRIAFEGTTLQPPADMTRVRVTFTPVDQQTMDVGFALPPTQVDASGHFIIAGVSPGRYRLRANAPPPGGSSPGAGQGGVPRGAGPGGLRPGGSGAAGFLPPSGDSWVLKSAVVAGRDTLDFPVEIGPNENPTDAVVTFTDRTQELSGTLQDASGRPTSDYTIIVFPVDNRYWIPQSRRIASARPGTDGKFTVRSLPPGEYRIAAVTDAEPGEWYDPSFLSQILSASLPISLATGEKKTHDIKLAGGGSSDRVVPGASSTRR